jgi:hypothetical protein
MASPRSARLLVPVLVLMVLGGCTSGSDDVSDPTPTGPTGVTTATCRLQADKGVSGVDGNHFAAVAFVSPNDVWAVGSHFEVSKTGALAQHWDGSAWDTVLAGSQRYHGLQLTDVAAIAHDDVVMVGFSGGGAASLRWDGSSLSATPAARGFAGATFLGVAARSATDLWAVGKATAAGGYDIPIAQRSDGSTWRAVTVPKPTGIAAGLHDVAVSGSDSAWAVGWSVDDQKVFRPLVEHWDGHAWTIRSTPAPTGDALLSGVAAAGPDDVWAVGWSWKEDAATSLVLHWDGSAWSSVRLPGSGAAARLSTVAAEGDQVVVGGQAANDAGIRQPIALRLHGTTWTEHATPIEPGGGGFQGIALAGRDGMIAVGSQLGADGYASLVQTGC